VERASQLAAVEQFRVFADIEALETSMRAERGYTTSVVILGGEDAAANEEMFRQRSYTDYVLLSLPVWPDGLAINNVPMTTRAHLGDMLNALRGKVSTLSVDFHDVLKFYSEITKQFMYWLLVIRQLLFLICFLNAIITLFVIRIVANRLTVNFNPTNSLLFAFLTKAMLFLKGQKRRPEVPTWTTFRLY